MQHTLQQAANDPLTFNQMIQDLLKFSLIKRLTEENMLTIHRLVQAVQLGTMELEVQHQWAERVVRAVNKVFPDNPKDIATWSQCFRYLDQVQACDSLIEQYIFPLFLSKKSPRRLFSFIGKLTQRVGRAAPRTVGAKSLPLIDAAHLLSRAGLYLDAQALYEVAEPLLKQALTIREQLLGMNHPSTAGSLNNLAGLYGNLGRYEIVEPLYKRALAIFKSQFDTEHLSTATTLNNLGMLYQTQGRYEEAEPVRSVCVKP